ncbi:uncharacterized protein [Physcomitrium patens]|uniref:uncharacterized protein n=1 Tax=Physcomitrium patens TaxID=3218 RepID=UPI003CCE2F6F
MPFVFYRLEEALAAATASRAARRTSRPLRGGGEDGEPRASLVQCSLSPVQFLENRGQTPPRFRKGNSQKTVSGVGGRLWRTGVRLRGGGMGVASHGGGSVLQPSVSWQLTRPLDMAQAQS